jgi:hypothetical protein
MVGPTSCKLRIFVICCHLDCIPSGVMKAGCSVLGGQEFDGQTLRCGHPRGAWVSMKLCSISWRLVLALMPCCLFALDLPAPVQRRTWMMLLQRVRWAWWCRC